jgi:hypothetical protein
MPYSSGSNYSLVSADRSRAYRERQRGGPPRAPQPCGTYAAYRRHQRHGEPIDDACREAYNAQQRAWHAARSPQKRK